MVSMYAISGWPAFDVRGTSSSDFGQTVPTGNVFAIGPPVATMCVDSGPTTERFIRSKTIVSVTVWQKMANAWARLGAAATSRAVCR